MKKKRDHQNVDLSPVSSMRRCVEGNIYETGYEESCFTYIHGYTIDVTVFFLIQIQHGKRDGTPSLEIRKWVRLKIADPKKLNVDHPKVTNKCRFFGTKTGDSGDNFRNIQTLVG